MKKDVFMVTAFLIMASMLITPVVSVRADSGSIVLVPVPESLRNLLQGKHVSIGVPFAYDYLIGSGILCDFGPEACPAIAKAAQGDTIEITGSGSFTTHPRSVSGGGSFVHKDPEGSMVGKGTWVATKFLAFRSYGCGGEGLPDHFCGGRAFLQIHLIPEGGGPGFDGILIVDCLIGHVPPGAEEGIKLRVFGGPNFHEIVSGFTLFID